MIDYIVLIRRKPSPETAAVLMRDLREAVELHGSTMVFFHGDGVDASREAASGWPEEDTRIDWRVCRTSLERRAASAEAASRLRTATLVTFYHGLLSARRVDSVGAGGYFCCRPESDDRSAKASSRILLEVGFAPADRRQRRETLEMALGAAALELDAAVLFHGGGVAHLVGEGARAWAQITDFDLLGIYVEAAALSPETEIDVRTVDAAQAADLRTGAATILIL